MIIKADLVLAKQNIWTNLIFPKEQLLARTIYSNEIEMVSQAQFMFEYLWNNAVSVERKFKEF
jgi:hypothetical protein